METAYSKPMHYRAPVLYNTSYLTSVAPSAQNVDLGSSECRIVPSLGIQAGISPPVPQLSLALRAGDLPTPECPAAPSSQADGTRLLPSPQDSVVLLYGAVSDPSP